MSNKTVKRRVISVTSMTTQITTDKGAMVRDNLAALCNDGTMWIAEVIDNRVSWTLFPDVPQGKVNNPSRPEPAPKKPQLAPVPEETDGN